MQAKINLHSGLLIYVILAVAALLRFWGVWDLPFHYDELSAIFRARAETWEQHWQTGVLPDGHPPGVQTFLWLWVKLFGEHPLPLHWLTASMGVAAVYFIFKAGKQLFGMNAGLMAAGFYAVSYLPLVWSQQIRPYSFGMLWCAALLWVWAVTIRQPQVNKRLFWLFGILAGLGALTHYFAGLFGVMLWASAVILIPHARKQLLFSGGIALLIFSPGLPVFFHQIKNGGLDWLGKPDVSFITEHLNYAFNGKWLFAGIMLPGLLLARLSMEFQGESKMLWLLLLLFIIPIALGFAWSHFAKPVLQHSVLLFSMPLLYLCFARLFDQAKQGTLLYLALPALMLHGLWQSRYFPLQQKSGYREQVRQMGAALKLHPGMTVLADGPEDVIAYHLKNEKLKTDLKYISHSRIPFSYARFDSLLNDVTRQNKPLGLMLNSGSHPGIIPWLEHRFGKPKQRHSHPFTEFLLFDDGKSSAVDYETAVVGKDSGLHLPLQLFWPLNNGVLVFHLPDSGLAPNTELIFRILRNNRQIDFRSAKKSDFHGVGDGTLFLFVKTADIPGLKNGDVIQLNISADGKPMQSQMKYRKSEGNPYLYGVEWF